MEESRGITTKKICSLGIGIALYVVLGMSVKIPLIAHIQTDLGYIVFGVYCYLYGPWGAVVGAVGCVIESVLFNGWFPPGWFLGQICIGIISGRCLKIAQRKYGGRVRILYMSIAAILSILMGIGAIKTVVECRLYQIPLLVKIPRNMTAAFADIPPMIAGILMGERIHAHIET